ncbi:family 16 glycosylhydrolase [Paenibacillus qinlingensis]|uniref:Beta-glucanase (GH16 family) n=1 Tax=Paenibacillus qinlingensis TaxID=1837343 RepID=A0ABU1P1T7_9BACL|nr:family 16 glycosylhydrolase [Paenibacillus qinlingensis]MDR6553673.1 beta-glucanase (GH16 family) [Paenibacillus qinlingensis]
MVNLKWLSPLRTCIVNPLRTVLPVCLLATATLSTVLPDPVSAAAPAGYTLYYADEFNDTVINEDDWMYRDAGPYSLGYNRKENVRESGGSLHIDFKREQINGTWYNTCGGIVSKKLFGYGYYETRAKLFNSTTGLHSSFWSMGLSNHIAANNITGLTAEIAAGNLPFYNQATEIDGFEHDSANGYYDTGTITYIPGYGSPRQHVNVTPDAWHIYGYEWTPTAIKFYLDGTLVNTINTVTTPMPFAPANFWLTALGYRTVSDYTKLPGESEFDYFRFYAKSYPAANLLGNPQMEFTVKDTSKGYTDQDTPNWIETYDKDASFMTTTDAHTGTRSLKHAKGSNYLVTTKQNLNGIANDTYQLSAWVKSSGGQAQAQMRVLNYGGTEMNITVPTTSTWTQITLNNIPVTNGQATIAFTSNANSSQWMLVDDVIFSEVSATTVYEAESLPVTTSTGDSQTNYNDAVTGKSFNNLNGNGVGDYVQYTVNVPQTGTYTVYVGNRSAFNKGIYQLAVNGTNLGSTVDQYAATSGYMESNLGTVAISTTGNQTFRFTVTGKNTSASTYQLAYDYITLVKN